MILFVTQETTKSIVEVQRTFEILVLLVDQYSEAHVLLRYSHATRSAA